MRITKQKMFDNACLGIIGQNYKPAVGVSGRCITSTVDGLRCALGWSCTDLNPLEEETIRSAQWDEMDCTFIGRRLKNAHDYDLKLSKRAWQNSMAKIAIDYKLDDSCLWMELVG